jgi:endonuclease/exonuclease/phosphatase family metal-dependent hydrolase
MTKKLAAISLIVSFVCFEVYKTFEKAPQLSEISENKGGETNHKRIRLMTYNVENLFDTKDAPDKDDETFLPLSKKNNSIQKKCRKSAKRYWIKDCLETNWTPFKLEKKMERLALVIMSAKPDVLILQEVENFEVLRDFNQKHLGYPTVILIEGPDKRGIDVAILSKLPENKAAKIHLQRSDGGRIRATRGILEANLRLPNGENLKVFGIHFPSQGSPTKSRIQSVKMLNSLKKQSSGLVIAGGDFNIINSESFLYKKELSAEWRVSHLEGCHKCKGSNYYHRKRSWSFLDALLFSKNFNKTWKLDKNSIQIFNSVSVQNNRYGSPAKFEMGKNPTGVSDHWPVVAEIHL